MIVPESIEAAERVIAARAGITSTKSPRIILIAGSYAPPTIVRAEWSRQRVEVGTEWLRLCAPELWAVYVAARIQGVDR